MGILKRFNREQLTLGAAGLLSALLFGWQLARAGVEAGPGDLPKNDRVYNIGRQSPVEFLDSKVTEYLKGRDIWEPPAAGRLPIPDIRPPEPRLGQLTLPPLSPRPDDSEFMKALLPGKFRWIASSVAPAPIAGMPTEEEIAALTKTAEVDTGGVVDKRKQLMRPNGLAIVHRLPPLQQLEGRIVVDTDQSSDGSLKLEVISKDGLSKTGIPVPPSEIDRSKGEEGIDRGWEYGKEFARRARRLKPDDGDGHRKLGDWARDIAGMIPESRLELQAAVEAWTKKQELGAKMRATVESLVATLKAFGSYDEAIAALQKYIDSVKGTDNDSAELHLSLGEMYESLGYHERSLISYDAAYQLQPGRARPRIALARARLNLGETKLALDEIDALLVGGANEPEALTVQGVARLRRGQAEAAEDSFKAALKAKPTDSEALNGLGVALALQNKPGAAANFVASIKQDQYRIDAWLNLAILYLAEGRAAEAEGLLNAAAQRDPDSSTAAAGAGFLALLKGTPGEAGPAFERARKTQPDDYYMAYALGRLKLRERKAQEALDLFRAALKSNPDYLPATTDAALAYLMLAREEQRQITGAQGDRQAAFRERAEAHRGNAQTLLESSYRADPNSYAANVALGCVYASRGRSREANAAFDRAVAVNIGRVDPLIDYGRGFVDFWYGANSPKERLDLAALRFDVGSKHPGLTDPSDIEWRDACAKALQAIEEWRVQRILIEERFDNNQTSSANAWARIEAAGGPAITFAKNGAVIGDQGGAAPPGAFAALEHGNISQVEFLSAEGTLDVPSMVGFEAGFSLYFGAVKGAPPTSNGLHFVFLQDTAGGAAAPIAVFGGTSVAPMTRGPSRPANRVGTLPGSSARIRFKLDRRASTTENNMWIFEFSVWEESKASWRSLTEKNPLKIPRAMGDAATIVIQFWGRTISLGKKWSMGVDDVQVLGEQK